MTDCRRIGALAAICMFVACGTAQANGASAALRVRAADELYNLDDTRAMATLREATAADPTDVDAWRALAGAIFAHLGMLRGTMTVDSYLGRPVTKDVSLPPPPPDLASEFDTAIGRAITISRAQVAARPRDAQARYQLGAAVGIQASYQATIVGGVISAMRAAREAFDAHEKVLELDPSRGDAGLVVGSYRYLVSTLSMPMRWAAYVVGFGGGREQGVRLVERAASYNGDNQTDARVALLLLYNREGRFDAALGQLAALRERYPRNRLFWLESGSTLLRAHRPADAERVLNEGMQMLARDARARMLGEDALWFYRRGTARAEQGRTLEAQADLERALVVDGRRWVHGRAHLELGRIAMRTSETQRAREHFATASRLGDGDRDGASAARARELLKQLPQGR